jgi:hypothetical protein
MLKIASNLVLRPFKYEGKSKSNGTFKESTLIVNIQK